MAPDDESTAAFKPPDAAATGVADPPLIAAGRLLGGRYRLQRPLGQGGMAAVWRAEDERLRRPVAIKVISEALAHDAGYVSRFRREAKVAAGLQHPNLVAIYDFDAGARPYLVMEHISGGDLASRIAAGGAPDPERLARELLSALRHIHRAGVVHRDIKPQNVLLDEGGNARLTDFGIARPSEATALTRTGHVIGTERYLAPEVRAGEPASERSDLYSLGVLLDEVAPQGAPAAVWSLVESLRDPDPQLRPSSATAALAALERHGDRGATGSDTQPLAAAPSAAPPSRRRPATESPLAQAFEAPPSGRGRRLTAIAALALGGLAVVAVAALALGGDDGGGDDGAPLRTEAERPADARANGGERRAAAGAGSAAAEPAPSDESGSAGGANAEAGADDAGGADGAALNDQGFALVGQGRFDEAIPILERARETLAGGGDEATYHYATYNLATAYLGAGRAAEAIPLLRERLGYDDGQLAEVRATLERARDAAGRSESGGSDAGGEGGGPPPWANDDGGGDD